MKRKLLTLRLLNLSDLIFIELVALGKGNFLFCERIARLDACTNSYEILRKEEHYFSEYF